MDKFIALPRLPQDRLQAPSREVADLTPGEQTVLDPTTDVEVDEAGHVWVKMSAKVALCRW